MTDITKEFKTWGSFVHWFTIAAVASDTVTITDTMRENPKILTMQLNGEELDVGNALNRLKEECDRSIVDEVKNEIESLRIDILKPVEEKVQELVDELDHLIQQKLTKRPQ